MLEEAARTIFNYINGAYEIAKDEGFKSIISVFDFEVNGQRHHLAILCSSDDTCKMIEYVAPPKKNQRLKN